MYRRPNISEENVESQEESFLNSLRKSIKYTSQDLRHPQSTVPKIQPKLLYMKANQFSCITCC